MVYGPPFFGVDRFQLFGLLSAKNPEKDPFGVQQESSPLLSVGSSREVSSYNSMYVELLV
jgi:hypothetical protein